MDPRADKAALRHSISQRLAAFPAKDRSAESRSLCRRILEMLPPPPLTVTAFFPVADEVNILPLLEELLAKHYDLYLPRFEGGKMAFRKIDDVAMLKALPTGPFNIPESPLTAPLLDPQTLGIALIPGRAFTKTGDRLGRGNGGFDIWIRTQRTANPATQFWGICFERQLVDAIPMEAHDEHVDRVITARG